MSARLWCSSGIRPLTSPRQPAEVSPNAKSQREDAVDPALEDRREVAEVDGATNAERVGLRDLGLLGQDVLGHAAADECGDLGLRLAAQRPRRQPALDRPATRLDHLGSQVHQLEDVVGDVGTDVARRVPVAEHRVELDGVQVDDLAGVAGVGEPVGEPFEHAVAERLRILVRVDRQDLHGDSSRAALVRGDVEQVTSRPRTQVVGRAGVVG